MASRKKERLTFEEHEDIGLVVKNIHRYLTSLSVRLGNAYPQNHPLTRLSRKMHEESVSLKSELENAVFKEYPDDARIDIYYPTAEQVGMVDLLEVLREETSDESYERAKAYASFFENYPGVSDDL